MERGRNSTAMPKLQNLVQINWETRVDMPETKGGRGRISRGKEAGQERGRECEYCNKEVTRLEDHNITCEEARNRRCKPPKKRKRKTLMETMPRTLDELQLNKDEHAKILTKCPHCKKATTTWHVRVCEEMKWQA